MKSVSLLRATISSRSFFMICAIFFVSFFVSLLNTAHSATATASKPDSTDLAPEYQEIDDMTQGSSDAQIALVEYSSINCTHCAEFHKNFNAKFDAEFVNTGKAQIVLKHFPLDFAAVEYMSIIVKQPKEHWKPLFEKALATQKDWLGKSPETLGKILGISATACKSAMACEDTKRLIMAKRFNAEQVVEIDATPTFLILYRQNDKLEFELFNKGIDPDALLKRLGEIDQALQINTSPVSVQN